MTAPRDPDRLIHAFLLEGADRLHDQVYDAVRADIEQRRQRVVIGPWRVPDMNKLVPIGAGIAAVVVAAIVGTQLLAAPAPGGVGAAPSVQPSATPSPTLEPTDSPSPIPTPAFIRDGDLAPGTSVFRPLPSPHDALTVTYTVPEGWSAFAWALIPAGDPGTGSPGGIAIQFDDVTSLNGDPCHWSGTADDVPVGSTVDDLVDALAAQTAYEVSAPVDVTIGGYQGKRVDVVYPTEPFDGDSPDAPGCDGGRYRLWSTASTGEINVYAQGPANRWQANILDVAGTRLVIVAMDFPGTLSADRAEVDAIIESIAIEP